ncbi:MAG: STAS domain-containing protein [Planctomycetota bacterium]|nr:STAS domain-containing protein [Planctomycetota bacterium]
MSQDRLIERMFELLISGDRTGAERLAELALGDGLTPQQLAQGAYVPLIRTINALHRAEQLTNLAHGYATAILDSLLDDAQRRGGPANGTAAHAQPCQALATRLQTAQTGGLAPGGPADHGGPTSPGAQPQREPPRRWQFVSFAIADRELTARLAGPSIGARQTPIIHTEINDVLHSLGPRLKRLVLDLSEVRSMSSMALGMCLDVRKTARAMGIRTAAVGMSPEMARVLRRLKLADGGRPARMVGALRNAFAS